MPKLKEYPLLKPHQGLTHFSTPYLQSTTSKKLPHRGHFSLSIFPPNWGFQFTKSRNNLKYDLDFTPENSSSSTLASFNNIFDSTYGYGSQ